jgi:FkbM family methyltransferase
MLIDFDTIVKKYGKPNGIIHIGAHLMEEKDAYLKHSINNILWIEANPEIFNQINIIPKNANEIVLNAVISNTDGDIVNFNITNNGQSSSILGLDKHKEYYPNICVDKTISVTTQRMDTLIEHNSIDIYKYNFVNIDIQGAELLALKGFGNLLKNISYIYTEINTNSLYKNCALLTEIDDYLNNFNFKRVEIEMTNFEWGDALYIKEN